MTLFLFLHWTKDYLKEETSKRLTSQARFIKHSLEKAVSQEETLIESAQLVWREAGDKNLHFKLSDHSGKILFDSQIEGPPPGELFKDSLEARTGMEVSGEKKEGEEQFFYTAVPLFVRDMPAGVVEISFPFSENKRVLKAFSTFFTRASAGSLFIGVIGIFLFMTWLIKPVLTLTKVADSIAGGNYEERAPLGNRQDELGRVARSVNAMADRLTGQLLSLEEERSSMKGLLATLMDGVVVLDSEMRVVFLNPAAERALRILSKDALFYPLAEIWPNPEMLTWVRENIAKRLPTSTDITIPHSPLRFFLLPVVEIPGKPEYVMLLFRDMSELRHFEEMRSRFMGHVSHELRTPLTIIKGNVITLLDESIINENPTYKRLLERMEDETERLAHLVEELLDYTRLKSGNIPLSLVPILLEELVLEVTDSFRDHALRYDVTVEVELPGKAPPILGDPGRVKQILLNLLDNALKYSPKGAAIRVSVLPEGVEDLSVVTLSVRDSGPGISPEELPFIFDRFYQGAKKQSKDAHSLPAVPSSGSSTKGWGLGLAIVKELAELHKAKISAESHLGQGTTLTVAFPCPYTKGSHLL